MHATPFLAETVELHIRADVVAALQQGGLAKQRDFTVESFKPSLWTRLAKLCSVKRAR